MPCFREFSGFSFSSQCFTTKGDRTAERHGRSILGCLTHYSLKQVVPPVHSFKSRFRFWYQHNVAHHGMEFAATTEGRSRVPGYASTLGSDRIACLPMSRQGCEHTSRPVPGYQYPGCPKLCVFIPCATLGIPMGMHILRELSLCTSLSGLKVA